MEFEKKINGKIITDLLTHALDQMENRGIPFSAVENARKTGIPKQIVRNNKTSINYYDKTNNITVVMNSKDEVITVGHGKIGK